MPPSHAPNSAKRLYIRGGQKEDQNLLLDFWVICIRLARIYDSQLWGRAMLYWAFHLLKHITLPDGITPRLLHTLFWGNPLTPNQPNFRWEWHGTSPHQIVTGLDGMQNGSAFLAISFCVTTNTPPDAEESGLMRSFHGLSPLFSFEYIKHCLVFLLTLMRFDEIGWQYWIDI